jgi:beta-lactamase class D
MTTMIDRRSLLALVPFCASAFAFDAARADSAIELKPELAQAFTDIGTQGTFVVFELAQDRLVMTDETRARRGELPAATFDIAHCLIALETGVVANGDEVIHWDGVVRANVEWNRDHTLRSAMQFSVVPVFEQIARRIGEERMRKYVESFGYGNRDIGGAPIDKFWQEGNLRISAQEQTRFLARLCRGDLPVSERSLRMTRDVVPSEQLDRIAFRAHTGTVSKAEKPVLGWLVGWVEREGGFATFAMNVDIHDPKMLAAQMPIAKSLLGKVGIL